MCDVFLTAEELLVPFKTLAEAEWTMFQIHYFSENLVVQGIEPRPLDL
jgi:hypothetical protein